MARSRRPNGVKPDSSDADDGSTRRATQGGSRGRDSRIQATRGLDAGQGGTGRKDDSAMPGGRAQRAAETLRAADGLRRRRAVHDGTLRRQDCTP